MSPQDASGDGTPRQVTERLAGELAGGIRASLAEWLTPPANRWAFRHAREVFRSERVAAAAGSRSPATVTALTVDETLSSYLERSFTDALVVLHAGRRVGEWYAPGVAPDDRHVVFSVTKSVVGLVVGALIAEGVIDEAATVGSYLPETLAGGYGTATVRDLLDMTANIRFVEDYDGPDVRRYREALGQVPAPHAEGVHAYVAALPAAGPHGGVFRYISPSTDVAAWVCERVTGRSLGKLISAYVWQPMGAEDDADLLLDGHGDPRAGGGLCATARDMARIGQLLLGDELDRALAPGVADVRRPADAAAWASGTLSEFIPGGAYRTFWYQPGGEPDVLLAAGIYGQRVYVDVHRQVVIAQQASLPGAYDERTWSETLPMFGRIARTVAGA